MLRAGMAVRAPAHVLWARPRGRARWRCAGGCSTGGATLHRASSPPRAAPPAHLAAATRAAKRWASAGAAKGKKSAKAKAPSSPGEEQGQENILGNLSWDSPVGNVRRAGKKAAAAQAAPEQSAVVVAADEGPVEMGEMNLPLADPSILDGALVSDAARREAANKWTRYPQELEFVPSFPKRREPIAGELLTPRQRQAVDWAREGRNVFIGGGVGSGKTETLLQITAALTADGDGWDPPPDGEAARLKHNQNLGCPWSVSRNGVLLASASPYRHAPWLGPDSSLNAVGLVPHPLTVHGVNPMPVYQRLRRTPVWPKVRVLIIDDAQYMDYEQWVSLRQALNMLWRARSPEGTAQEDVPLCGVPQVILAADFLAHEQGTFVRSNHGNYMFEDQEWETLFGECQLEMEGSDGNGASRVHDPAWAALLQRMRLGEPLPEDMEVLDNRVIDPSTHPTLRWALSAAQLRQTRQRSSDEVLYPNPLAQHTLVVPDARFDSLWSMTKSHSRPAHLYTLSRRKDIQYGNQRRIVADEDFAKYAETPGYWMFIWTHKDAPEGYERLKAKAGQPAGSGDAGEEREADEDDDDEWDEAEGDGTAEEGVAHDGEDADTLEGEDGDTLEGENADTLGGEGDGHGKDSAADQGLQAAPSPGGEADSEYVLPMADVMIAPEKRSKIALPMWAWWRLKEGFYGSYAGLTRRTDGLNYVPKGRRPQVQFYQSFAVGDQVTFIVGSDELGVAAGDIGYICRLGREQLTVSLGDREGRRVQVGKLPLSGVIDSRDVDDKAVDEELTFTLWVFPLTNVNIAVAEDIAMGPENGRVIIDAKLAMTGRSSYRTLYAALAHAYSADHLDIVGTLGLKQQPVAKRDQLCYPRARLLHKRMARGLGSQLDACPVCGDSFHSGTCEYDPEATGAAGITQGPGEHPRVVRCSAQRDWCAVDKKVVQQSEWAEHSAQVEKMECECGARLLRRDLAAHREQYVCKGPLGMRCYGKEGPTMSKGQLAGPQLITLDRLDQGVQRLHKAAKWTQKIM
eukprot:TRINITY_DN55596_c0_g1_i1.p1 TRINITY_DN55596_c0_g1~~TRINITY_DN55596_c0_g1_i1.p1  ORF type:complete len:1025 (+),score=224.88 TRINITY_DN55596_c0_g1_i1:74-3148(+)